MTEDEFRELTIAIDAVVKPYIRAGKVAGFRMVVALIKEKDAVMPLVINSYINDDIANLLKKPEFGDAADQVPTVEVERSH